MGLQASSSADKSRLRSAASSPQGLPSPATGKPTATTNAAARVQSPTTAAVRPASSSIVPESTTSSMLVSYLCEDGVTRSVDIAEAATTPFGLKFGQDVNTPRGPATVLGVAEGLLYFVLTETRPGSIPVATSFTVEEVASTVIHPTQEAAPKVETNDSHRLKSIEFRGGSLKVVLQGANGPCPVLAIANALILQGALPEIASRSGSRIPAKELRTVVLSHLLVRRPLPKFIVEDAPRDNAALPTLAARAAEHADAVHAVLVAKGEEILHRLYGGLYVSPIFSHVDGFDGDSDDVYLFALAGLRLLHAWIIPEEDAFAPLRRKSFNEVAVIATDTTHAENFIAQAFIERTRSQMTACGLSAVRDELADGEIGVLFWNNHFCTVVKNQGRLLSLLSDENYSDKACIVFEVIEDTHGNGTFVAGDGSSVDCLILAVESQTGSKYSESAIRRARFQLQAAGEAEPSVERVFQILDASKGRAWKKSPACARQGASNHRRSSGSTTISSPTTATVGDAEKLLGMGLVTTLDDAVDAIEKFGGVNAAANGLLQ